MVVYKTRGSYPVIQLYLLNTTIEYFSISANYTYYFDVDSSGKLHLTSEASTPNSENFAYFVLQNPHRCLITIIKINDNCTITDMYRSAYTIIPGGYFTPNMYETNNYTYFIITPLFTEEACDTVIP